METLLSTASGAGTPAIPDGLALGAEAGPWVVERELGSGGMGIVYEVVHRDIGKRAALKVVHGRAMHGASSDRMLVEARVVNRIRHPNIVDIFEANRLPDGRPYIVMERLEGQSLARRADERKLLPDEVIAILLQICDALSAAHAAGIVHRDLKLDNVFLVDNAEDPEWPRVKLLDWGIAKQIDDDVCRTMDGQLVGTPQYLAPEQARGAAVSPQTDVYSLGVMAWELFLEELPFEADTAAEIMVMHLRATPPPASDVWPEIPPRLEELLHGMLAKAPDARPTVAQVAHRLEQVRLDLEARCRFLRPRPDAPGLRVPARPEDGSRERPRPGSLYGGRRLAPWSKEWRPRRARWKIAAGTFALIASTCMFLLRPAASSSAPVVEEAHERTGLDMVRDPDAPGVGRDLHVPPDLELAAERVHAAEAPQVVEPADVPPTSVERPRPVPRVVVALPAPRHRVVEADGTVDPYR